MPEPLIHQHIRAVVAYENSYQARESALASYEANGERIISGGQTDDTWDVTDYRTGELLLKATTGWMDTANSSVSRPELGAH